MPLRQYERLISYCDFLSVAAQVSCTSLSVRERPVQAQRCRRYETDLETLLAHETFPVRYVSRIDRAIVPFNDSNAVPITFREFLAHRQYVESVLSGWRGMSGEWDRNLNYLALHCSGCDRVSLIDGTHRLTWLHAAGKFHVRLSIIELSGYGWPINAPDIGNICACKRATDDMLA